jgi:hypothetical protein
MNDYSDPTKRGGGTLVSNGSWTGQMPSDWAPRWDGYERGVEIWTDEQWDSWSAVKRQAMYEMWDELAYLSHRQCYPELAKRLVYAQAMYRLAVA